MATMNDKHPYVITGGHWIDPETGERKPLATGGTINFSALPSTPALRDFAGEDAIDLEAVLGIAATIVSGNVDTALLNMLLLPTHPPRFGMWVFGRNGWRCWMLYWHGKPQTWRRWWVRGWHGDVELKP